MIKRVYERVDVEPSGDGFAIVLDKKRRLRSPKGKDLYISGEALASAIAMEWDAQGAEIDPQTLRLTNLAGQSADITEAERTQIEASVVSYIETDLTCYRADEPPDLVSLQAAAWDSLLTWAHARYGQTPEVTTGVVPIVCEPSVVACFAAIVGAIDAHALAGLQKVTSISGSLIIGLAILERELDADAAWHACQIDESYQISRWGDDAEGSHAREIRRADLSAAVRFLVLLR